MTKVGEKKENVDQPKRALLPEEALGTARSIADWCEAQRQSAEALAAKQIMVVWVLLLGGLFLLLFLPRVIQEIEFLGRETSLPDQIMRVAEDSSELLRLNQNEMREEVAAARVRLEELSAIKTFQEVNYEQIATEIEAELAKPFRIWQDLAVASETDGLFLPKVKRLPTGDIYGVGTIRDLARGDLVAGILDPETGATPGRIRYSASDSTGTLFDFARLSDGEVIAVGHEGRFGDSKAIIVRAVQVQVQEVSGEATLPSDVTTDGTPLMGSIRFGATRLFSRDFQTLSGRQVIYLKQDENGQTVRVFPDNEIPNSIPRETVWVPEEISLDGVSSTGTLFGITSTDSDELLIAGRSGSLFEPQPLLLRKEDRSAKAVSVLPPSFSSGTLYQIDYVDADTMMTLGFETDTDGNFHTIILTSIDHGRSWEIERPQIAGERVTGSLLSFTKSEDGELLALGYEGTARDSSLLILRKSDQSGWEVLRPFLNDELAMGNAIGAHFEQDGTLVVASYDQTSRSHAILTSQNDLKNWSRIILTDGKSRPSAAQGVGSLIKYGDDQLIFSAANSLLLSISVEDQKEISRQLIENMSIPDGHKLPASVATQIEALRLANAAVEKGTADYEQQLRFVETTESSQKRQETAVGNLDQLTIELERALESSDTVRQVGQVATRLAVIALLVYLVQIVVNRFRYLQRIAGFYQARAQAFSLLAVSENKTALFDDLSLTDLTNLLSPDSIGFDKSAEPPTAQMVSLLQAGLKKG